MITKILVTSFILWTNLRLSIGQDYDNDIDYDGYSNETEPLIDWNYEAIVAVRWDIGNSPLVEYDKLRFDIHFSVSDYIETDKHVPYDIYQNTECKDAADVISDSDDYMETWVTDDGTPVGPGIDENVKRTVTISNQLNAQTISQLKSYEGEDETGNDASITYCVRLSLWNGEGPSDPEAIEINHIAVTVGLNLDLTEDFSITGQKVEAKSKAVETSDDQFFVEAFVCDETGKPPTLVAPLQQGDTVRICIQPTEQAAEVGFRMQRIEKFNFFQGMTSQGAILNAEVSSNLLTAISCQPGSRQCVFETLLFSYFYQNNPQGAVIGSGEATLQWGGEGFDRRLRLRIESLPEVVESTEDKENLMMKYDERFLQERASTKSIQVPTFAVLADERKRPRLMANSRSRARTQKSLLVSLVVIFCLLLLLPLIYYSRKRYQKRELQDTDAEPSSEPITEESEDERSSVDDKPNRWSLPIIPEDRTIISVRTFLTKGFY